MKGFERMKEFYERNKMKKAMKKLWLALAAVVSWVGVAVAADIQYVADNGGGEYSGAG